MTCRNLCKRYKAKKIFGVGRYISGQKRCTFCGVWMIWDGLYCPCCTRQLKTGPTAKKYREKLKEARKN